MKIAVFGTGYVGLVSGVCFASLGIEVVCFDKNPKIIDTLNSGVVHIHENGLQELLEKVMQHGKITFRTDFSNLDEFDALVIAVGTPASADGSANLDYLFTAVNEIAAHCSDDKFIIIKSTVPIGTASQIRERLKSSGKHLSIISNPEFLREGSAVKDFLEPDRIVIGIDNKKSEAFARRLYSPYLEKDTPIFFTDNASAELIKYASNCFLATRIAFINEMADIAERVGADIESVAEGMGFDKRIGKHYLHPGPGFGGSCFPKDTQALLYTSKSLGAKSSIVQAVIESNDQRKKSLIEKVADPLHHELSGKKIAVLGATFKANTDDMRDAASLDLIPQLYSNGASIRIYDPSHSKQAQQLLGAYATFEQTLHDCLMHADAAVILTEWPEFRLIDLTNIATIMKRKLIVDFRNLFKLEDMKNAGFEYISVGRPNA